MRITILAYGTRGDVQPFVALAIGLRDAGHQVTISAHSQFRDLLTTYGVQQHVSQFDFRAVLRGEKLPSRNYQMRTIATDARDACQSADLFIANNQTYFLAESIAEATQTPYVQASVFPITPFEDNANPLFSAGKDESTQQKFAQMMQAEMYWLRQLALVNDARTEVLGLSRLKSVGRFKQRDWCRTTILACSRHILPPLAAHNQQTHVTGFLFLPDPPSWRPPAHVEAFIEHGAAPVCFGFGSMTDKDAVRTTKAIIQAVTATNQRAILLSGWGGLASAELPDTILSIPSISHRWLFPRTAITVHHAGAGTTACSLWAGKPMILRPTMIDHPFWARRMVEIGLATPPLPLDFSAEALTTALHTVRANANMHTLAVQLSQQIRQESGVQQAVAVINQCELEAQPEPTY